GLRQGQRTERQGSLPGAHALRLRRRHRRRRDPAPRRDRRRRAAASDPPLADQDPRGLRARDVQVRRGPLATSYDAAVRTAGPIILLAACALGSLSCAATWPRYQSGEPRGPVYPQAHWERIQSAESVGYSTVGLQRVRELVRTLSTTGL